MLQPSKTLLLNVKYAQKKSDIDEDKNEDVDNNSVPDEIILNLFLSDTDDSDDFD